MDSPQTACSNISPNTLLGTVSTDFVNQLVRLKAKAAGDDLFLDLVVPPKIHASRDLLRDLLLFSLGWARCARRHQPVHQPGAHPACPRRAVRGTPPVSEVTTPNGPYLLTCSLVENALHLPPPPGPSCCRSGLPAGIQGRVHPGRDVLARPAVVLARSNRVLTLRCILHACSLY